MYSYAPQQGGLLAYYILSMCIGSCEYEFLIVCNVSLKVPKCEIFVTELFILSDPIWVGDLSNEPKKPFVESVRLIFTILFLYRWLSMR